MKMMAREELESLVVVITPAEEGGFFAYCPQLPGCASQGETYAETVANIQEAIEGMVETMQKFGDLPATLFKKNYVINVPVTLRAKTNQ